MTFADPELNTNPSILFNPNQGYEFEENGIQKAGSNSPSVSLMHEFGHAWLWKTMPRKYRNMYNFNDPKYGNQMTEELTMRLAERPAAQALNEGVRFYYSPVTNINVSNVKSNKRAN